MTEPFRSAPWQEVEIELTADAAWTAPYTDVEVWADFACGDEVLRRPAFWDGGDRWRLRFAAPHAGDWEWATAANVDDPGLAGRAGTVVCVDGLPAPGRVCARSSTASGGCRRRVASWCTPTALPR